MSYTEQDFEHFCVVMEQFKDAPIANYRVVSLGRARLGRRESSRRHGRHLEAGRGVGGIRPLIPRPKFYSGGFDQPQFYCGLLSSERPTPARPCAERCAAGKCQPCLIAMKRRPKHKAPPARAEMP